MPTYNRDWLRAQIRGYLHDDSVDSISDTWIDIGAKRVSQILECAEMEADLTRATGAPDAFIALPSNVRKLLGVQWFNASRWSNLRSVPRHLASAYSSSGTPCVYKIESRNVYPLPYVDGDYKAQVLQDVVIPDDAFTETPALSAHPYMFLNAALAEAYDWKQNMEMVQRYEAKWSAEADTISAEYNSEITGEVPAMRAI
jgi:hypothetical protein